jgi:hypothetical protein
VLVGATIAAVNCADADAALLRMGMRKFLIMDDQLQKCKNRSSGNCRIRFDMNDILRDQIMKRVERGESLSSDELNRLIDDKDVIARRYRTFISECCPEAKATLDDIRAQVNIYLNSKK